MTQPEHIQRLVENLREVRRLSEIHAVVAGKGPGHKHDVEVLNKSAVVLLVACWEAFVEDLASASFSWLISKATDPSVFPPRVRVLAAKRLRADPDEREIWKLAGEGWKAVLEAHRAEAISKFVSPLNTPRAEQVDRLFQSLIGLSLSPCWHWHGMPIDRAQATLDRLITLRGEIAHRVAATKAVRMRYVRDMRGFVVRLAVVSHNAVGLQLKARTGVTPWFLRLGVTRAKEKGAKAT